MTEGVDGLVLRYSQEVSMDLAATRRKLVPHPVVSDAQHPTTNRRQPDPHLSLEILLHDHRVIVDDLDQLHKRHVRNDHPVFRTPLNNTTLTFGEPT